MFFSAPHEIFFKFHNTQRHKTNLNKQKKIKRKLCILSKHHELKLDINNSNNRKVSKSWKLNNSLLNIKWVKSEVKKEMKDFLELENNE